MGIEPVKLALLHTVLAIQDDMYQLEVIFIIWKAHNLKASAANKLQHP